jgi:hypothetical protein
LHVPIAVVTSTANTSRRTPATALPSASVRPSQPPVGPKRSVLTEYGSCLVRLTARQARRGTRAGKRLGGRTDRRSCARVVRLRRRMRSARTDVGRDRSARPRRGEGPASDRDNSGVTHEPATFRPQWQRGAGVVNSASAYSVVARTADRF